LKLLILRNNVLKFEIYRIILLAVQGRGRLKQNITLSVLGHLAMHDRPEILVVDYIRHRQYDGVSTIVLSATVSRDRKLGVACLQQL
jgi:hypothetical protein